MSNLQHGRITALAHELRLTALPGLYGAIAQNAAKKEHGGYADFLEDILKAERDARRVRSREMLTRTAGFPAIKTLEAYDFRHRWLFDNQCQTSRRRSHNVELASGRACEKDQASTSLSVAATGACCSA